MSVVSQLPERPGEEREAMILDAVVRGEYLPIEWVPIEIETATARLTILVAEDALRLGDEKEWARVNATHTTAQQICDVLGVSLPTTKISDLIHQHALVVITASTQTPDSRMAYTSRMIKHSDTVSEKIAGRNGLVSTVGKDWALTNSLVGQPNKAANYGWHDKSGGYTSPGGIKLWQPLGLAHNPHHVDYSQVLRFVSRVAFVNDTQVDLMDLLFHEDRSKALSYEGVLELDRHPGVPFYRAPVPPPTQSESLDTLGKRCVDWCMSWVGTKERDPKVSVWMQPCVRGYEPHRKPLGLRKGNWCAAFQCAAVTACLRDGDPLPHDYRAGVVELVQDTSPDRRGEVPFAGSWMPVTAARENAWRPSVGDLAVWDRSVPGKPDTAWHRHVNRVTGMSPDGSEFSTVGGNERNEVRVNTHKTSHPKLLGWIHYPGNEPAETELTDAEKEKIGIDVEVCLQKMVDEYFSSVKDKVLKS